MTAECVARLYSRRAFAIWMPKSGHDGWVVRFNFQNSGTVIASEAKQSILPRKERKMDCFAALAMTALLIPNTTSRSRGAMRPRRAFIFRPKRAWGMPGAVAPAASCALGSGRTHTSNNEYTGIARHPRTQWFYGLCRALPGDRAFLPPSPREYGFALPGRANKTSARLDASVGASGPHDFAVRESISRQRAQRSLTESEEPALRSHRAHNAAASTATHPAFRDGHDTPLLWGGMGRICRDDLPDG